MLVGRVAGGGYTGWESIVKGLKMMLFFFLFFFSLWPLRFHKTLKEVTDTSPWFNKDYCSNSRGKWMQGNLSHTEQIGDWVIEVLYEDHLEN